MKSCIAALLSAMLFVSCAASLPYGIDYPLTDRTFRSRDGAFTGRVPQGWFSSTGDTLVPSVVAWLIKDDLSAALSIKELNLDRVTALRVEKDGLGLLAHISAGLHQSGPDSATVAVAPREFEMQGKKFCSYEIVNGGKRTRIVVFSAHGKFYECEAVPVKGQRPADELARMFTAQQTFLAWLRF